MPPNYVAIAANAARRYGFDESIFIAQMNIESGFNPQAVSPAGASGIAQFMPATWTGVIDQHPELLELFGNLGSNIRDPSFRFSPELALYAAAAHMSDMLRFFDGDYRAALGGYYAGQGAARGADGVYYANLVMGQVPGVVVPPPTGGVPPMLPEPPKFDLEQFEELRERFQADLERMRQQFEDLLTANQIEAQSVGPDRTSLFEPSVRPVPPPGSTPSPSTMPSTPAGSPRESLQGDALQSQLSRQVGRAAAQNASNQLRQAQLGAIVNALKETGVGLATVAGGVAKLPGIKQGLQALELEQNVIGRPIAKVALAPFRPIIPDKREGLAEDILSGFVVPSNFIPFGTGLKIASNMVKYGKRGRQQFRWIDFVMGEPKGTIHALTTKGTDIGDNVLFQGNLPDSTKIFVTPRDIVESNVRVTEEVLGAAVPDSQRAMLVAWHRTPDRAGIEDALRNGDMPLTRSLSGDEPLGAGLYGTGSQDPTRWKATPDGEIVRMELRGNFVTLNNMPAAKEIDQFMEYGFSGAIIGKQTGLDPQIVVWRNEAVHSFGTYETPLRKAAFVAPGNELSRVVALGQVRSGLLRDMFKSNIGTRTSDSAPFISASRGSEQFGALLRGSAAEVAKTQRQLVAKMVGKPVEGFKLTAGQIELLRADIKRATEASIVARNLPEYVVVFRGGEVIPSRYEAVSIAPSVSVAFALKDPDRLAGAYAVKREDIAMDFSAFTGHYGWDEEELVVLAEKLIPLDEFPLETARVGLGAGRGPVRSVEFGPGASGISPGEPLPGARMPASMTGPALGPPDKIDKLRGGLTRGEAVQENQQIFKLQRAIKDREQELGRELNIQERMALVEEMGIPTRSTATTFAPDPSGITSAAPGASPPVPGTVANPPEFFSGIGLPVTDEGLGSIPAINEAIAKGAFGMPPISTAKQKSLATALKAANLNAVSPDELRAILRTEDILGANLSSQQIGAVIDDLGELMSQGLAPEAAIKQASDRAAATIDPNFIPGGLDPQDFDTPAQLDSAAAEAAPIVDGPSKSLGIGGQPPLKSGISNATGLQGLDPVQLKLQLKNGMGAAQLKNDAAVGGKGSPIRLLGPELQKKVKARIGKSKFTAKQAASVLIDMVEEGLLNLHDLEIYFNETLPGMFHGGIVTGIAGGVKGALDATGGALDAVGLQEPLRQIGSGLAQAAAPIVKPVFKALELEERFVGRPLTSALITPLKPFIGEGTENVLISIGGAVLVPSTFLLPFPGRAVAIGSILSKAGMKSLLHPSTVARTAMEARAALRVAMPNQAKLAAQIHVATRATAGDPEVVARRLQSEGFSRQLNELEEFKSGLRSGEEKAFDLGFGKTVNHTKESVTKEIDKLRMKIRDIKQAAISDHRLDLSSIATSTDPQTLWQVEYTLQASKTIARYNPSIWTKWRKNITGFPDELSDALRWNLKMDAPAHLTVKAGGGKTAAQAAEETAENKQNWSGSLSWIENLMREGAFDTKGRPGTVFNWVYRASEPLAHIPIVGGVLGAGAKNVGKFFQPIAEVSDGLAGIIISGSRYRQAAQHASRARGAAMEMAIINRFGTKGLEGEQILKAAFVGGAPRLRAEEFVARYLKYKSESKTPSSFAPDAIEEMTVKAEKEFKRAEGTVLDVLQNKELYELDDEGTRVAKFLDDAFNADRDQGFGMGVSIGKVNGDFFPRARAANESLNLGSAGRVVYPRSFHSRSIEDWDDYIGALAIDGHAVEYNLTNLIDRRLGRMAEKKSFQAMLRMMSESDEMARYVERPLVAKTGAPMKREELVRRVERMLKREMTDEEAQVIAVSLTENLPEAVPIREVEFLLGREYNLVRADSFEVGSDDYNAIQRLERWMSGARTVEVDENFASRTVDFFRTVLLSADASPIGFVQGARVFAQDPVAYVRAIGSAAAWNMTTHGRRVWALQNASSLQFAASKGLQLGNPLDIKLSGGVFGGRGTKGLSLGEKFAQNPGETVLGPIAFLNREMMDAVGQAKLHLFNTTYSTLMVAQADDSIGALLKGLPIFKSIMKGKEWKKMNLDELGEAVAEGLNNYIGPIEFVKIRPEGRPSGLEKLALLTPSWTRGNIGMILNAPKMGAKGVVARHLFMNQIAVQTMLATKLSLAISGQMPEFDPTSSSFLAVKAPGFRFALMPTMSAFRLPFRILAGRPESERFEEENVWERTGNELSRFFEGRMGQTLRVTADLLSGEDFLGRKIDSRTQFIIKEALPIIGQEIWESVEEGNIPAGEMAARTSLEFLGSAVIPKTPFKLYRERVELMTGVDFDDLTTVQIRRLEREDEELQGLRKRQKQYRVRRGDALNQFFNTIDDSRTEMNDMVTKFIDQKEGQEGWLAEYVRLSAQSLAQLGAESEAAMEAIFGSREEFESRLREQPVRALDEVAQRYWSLDPDDFTYQNKPFSLATAFFDADPDGYRDELWRSFRLRRDQILDEGAKEFGLTRAQVEGYAIVEWPSVRWKDSRAGELEVRRVAAQRALDELFSRSPYLWPDNTEMSNTDFDRLHELRLQVEQMLTPFRAAYRAIGQPMPDGTRRTAVLQLAGQVNADDRKLLYWMTLWDRQDFRDSLRNPLRDQILIGNPDAIKFFPDRVGSLLSSRLLNTPLANDPEVMRIISSSLAR